MTKIMLLAPLLLSSLASAPPATPAVTVHIKDYAFKAPDVTVHPGDTVLFVNDDDDAHTVTANDNSFDSKGLDTSQHWQFTFTKPGTYPYFCQIHPYMKGKIVVKAASQ